MVYRGFVIFSVIISSAYTFYEEPPFYGEPIYEEITTVKADTNQYSSYAEIFLKKLSESNAIVKSTLNLEKRRTEDAYSYFKIYGAGQEYSFPPWLELILQRLQSRFSVYKLHDDSRPVKVPLINYTPITI